jgi:hypothetical protein
MWLKWKQIRIRIGRSWMPIPILIRQHDAGPTDPGSDQDAQHCRKPLNFCSDARTFLTKINCRTAAKYYNSFLREYHHPLRSSRRTSISRSASWRTRRLWAATGWSCRPAPGLVAQREPLRHARRWAPRYRYISNVNSVVYFFLSKLSLQ